MSNSDPIRLRQRLESLDRVLAKLEAALARENPGELEVVGTIHFFEVSMELFWKAMKDALYLDGTLLASPKPVMRKAVESGWISDAKRAVEMVELRNQFAHRYDEDLLEGVAIIRDRYLPLMFEGRDRLKEKLRADA